MTDNVHDLDGHRFEGKIAIITGAGGAIGGAAARRLAAEGATVLAVDRDEQALKATLATVESDGGSAATMVADVTDAASVRAYVDAARDLGRGEVHTFFNNAGIEGPLAALESYDDDAFDRVVAVNLRGVFLGLKYVARAMPEGGAILNTASTAGVTGFAGGAGYVASKHAVIGLTRAAAQDLAPRNIRVNAICPGPVEGRMMASLEDQSGLAGAREAFLSKVPLGRYATPEDITSVVAFLLSDSAGYVTASTFAVDGGQTQH